MVIWKVQAGIWGVQGGRKREFTAYWVKTGSLKWSLLGKFKVRLTWILHSHHGCSIISTQRDGTRSSSRVYNLGALNKDVVSSMAFIRLWLSKCASSRARDFLSGRSPSLPTWDLRYILNIEKPKHFSSKRLQTPSSPAGKHMFQWVSRLSC